MSAMEMDFTDQCDKVLPECEALAKEGRLNEALDKLLALEKETRLASDAHSNGRVAVAIVELCFQAHNYQALNENILLLAKRGSLIKASMNKVFDKAFEYLDKISSKEEKLKFVETLRTVAVGKMYLETEAVKLARILAKMKEEEGDLPGASSVMQDVKVECLGALDPKEKVDFLLEQIRLTLATKDYVRAQIIARKIHPKFFETGDVEELKTRYYRLMLRVDQHDRNYSELTKHYYILFKMAAKNQDDEETARKILKSTVLCCVLTPYDPEQEDFMRRLKTEKLLQTLPIYENMLDNFLLQEIINWTNFDDRYKPEFTKNTNILIDAFATSEEWFKDLRLRVIEHNIFVCSKYCTRITILRMSQFLETEPKKTVDYISDMVNKRLIRCKIDCLEEVVQFEHETPPTEVMNRWSETVDSLMNRLTVATHLINKEMAVHGAREGGGDLVFTKA